MAKRRERLQTRIRGQGFQPVASPTDRFSRSSKGQGLAQLASALSEIAPALERYALVADDIQDKKAAKEGEAERIEDVQAIIEAQATYQEAEDLGIIRNHQNPIKRAVYREGLGRFFAEQATDAFQQYKAENLSEALTLEEFDSGWNDFLGSWMEENMGEQIDEPAMATAFQETIQQRRQQERRNFSQQAQARFESRSNEVFHQTVFSGTANLVSEGASAQEIADFVSSELEVQQAVNGTSDGHRRRNNRTALTGLLSAAERIALTSDNPLQALEVLDAIQQIKSGTGTLGGASWAQDLIEDAEADILRNIGNSFTLANQQAERELDALIEDAHNSLFEDPRQSLSSFQERINGLGLSAQSASATIRSLKATRDALIQSENVPSVPQVVRDIQLQIWANPNAVTENRLTIRSALAGRELSSGDAQNLYSLTQQYGGLTEDEPAFDDGAYDRMVREFRALFGSEVAGDFSHEDAVRREQGMAEYNKAWRDWFLDNPDASVDEKETRLLEISEHLQQRYGLETGAEALRNRDWDTPVPRDPRLTLARWQRARIPTLTDETFGVMLALYNEEVPLEVFPPRAQAAFVEFISSEGINPADEELVRTLLDAQTPFFTENDPNNTPER